MKSPALAAVLVLCVSVSTYAHQLGMGGYSIAKTAYSIVSLSESDTSGNLSWGVTFNGNLSGKDISVESAVVDIIDYDDGTTGVHYAALKGYDLGYGLLVNGMDTEIYQPSFPRNDQKALALEYDTGNFEIDGFGTYGHLYGGQVKDISLFGMNIGLEFASDATISSDESFGSCATGAFITLPLTDSIALFAESASGSGGGAGSQAGISLGYDMLISYMTVHMAAVSFNDKFIPGYFTAGYDIDPVDIASLETGAARYGSVISLDTSVIDLIGLHYTSENFTDGGTANSGSMTISPVKHLTLSAYVKELTFLDYRPIKGKDANLVGGYLEFVFDNGISISVNYKKTPLGEDGKPYDTSFCKLAYNF